MSIGPEGDRNQLCVQIKASTVVGDSDVTIVFFRYTPIKIGIIQSFCIFF